VRCLKRTGRMVKGADNLFKQGQGGAGGGGGTDRQT